MSQKRIPRNKLSTSERFFQKIAPVDKNGCMLWIGNKYWDGYGKFHVREISNNISFWKTVRAHRYAWELKNGPIPKGLYVCHKCDNPLCVNPDHMFLGTQKNNLEDMASKKRSTIGCRNPMSKLTDEDIRIIREMYKNGYTQQSIANIYSLSRSNIGLIVTNQTWKHVK
jgi:hypothetical protein